MRGSKEEALKEARELLEGVAPETANEEDVYVTLPRWVVASLVILVEAQGVEIEYERGEAVKN